MNICIINGKIILKDKVVENNLYIKDGKIAEISKRTPCDEEIIDACGQYVSPGFIDVHTHGRGGSDTMYPTFDDINTISNFAIKAGTTSFLATTVTMSIKDTTAAINNVATNINKVEGAKILGIHLEGPFFNSLYKGAQPEEHMLLPTVETFKEMVGNHTDIISKISLAPELEGALELANYLESKGIIASIGHSNATYQEVVEAIKNGFTSVTHLYNAMTPLTHRAPGIVGAAFIHDELFAELILDGVHVSFEAAKAAINAKGTDRITLITDSLEAAGLPDGKYKLGGHDIYVKDRAARLENGTLAGSVSGMNYIVYNAYKKLNLEIHEAVKMASLVPANSLNLYDIGEIAVNKKADIIIFNDDIEVSIVLVEGIIKL